MTLTTLEIKELKHCLVCYFETVKALDDKRVMQAAIPGLKIAMNAVRKLEAEIAS